LRAGLPSEVNCGLAAEVAAVWLRPGDSAIVTATRPPNKTSMAFRMLVPSVYSEFFGPA